LKQPLEVPVRAAGVLGQRRAHRRHKPERLGDFFDSALHVEARIRVDFRLRDLPDEEATSSPVEARTIWRR